MTDETKHGQEGADAPSFPEEADNVTVFRQAFDSFDARRAASDPSYNLWYCEQFGKMIASFVGTSAMRGHVPGGTVLNSLIYSLIAVAQAVDMSFLKHGKEPVATEKAKESIERVLKNWGSMADGIRTDMEAKAKEMAKSMETKGSA